MSVGFPQCLYLEEFGSQVYSAFSDAPFQVGSSITEKEWRDVDIRLILDDDEYKRLGLGDPRYPHHNAKWVSLCLAYSALGKAMTGLPIDFQIQQRTLANEKYKGRRSAIGIVPLRIVERDICKGCGTDFAEFPEMRHSTDECPGPECTCYEVISGHQMGCAFYNRK